MKNFLLFFFVLVASSVFAQQKMAVFPDDWLGVWRGRLEVRTPKGVVQELPMRFELTAADSSGVYNWLLVYELGEETDTRPYTLMPADSTGTHWIVDENNGILLDGWVFGERFVQYFTVNGSYILLSLEYRNEDELFWQIIAGQEESMRESGGKEVEGEEIPVVQSMPVGNVQSAVLKRQ